MSATSWGVCPICFENAKKDLETRRKSLNKEYGEIGFEKWEKKRSQLPDKVKLEDYRTLREDYEMGIMRDSGKFYAEYRAQCIECDAEFNFNRYKNNALDQ